MDSTLYEKGSSGQRHSNQKFFNFLQDLNLTPSLTTSPLVIADFGCSTAANSLAFLESYLNFFINDHNKIETQLFLNDVHLNDPIKVFQNFQKFAENYQKHKIFFSYVPGNAFKQRLSSNFVDLATCLSCIHWIYDSEIDQFKEDSLIFQFTKERSTDLLKQRAEFEYIEFLQNRQSELKNGGLLLITSGLTEPSLFDPNNLNEREPEPFSIIWKVWQSFVKEKNIEKLLGHFSLNFYYRSVEELEKPFKENLVPELDLISIKKDKLNFRKDYGSFIMPLIHFSLKNTLVDKLPKVYNNEISQDEALIIYEEALEYFPKMAEELAQSLNATCELDGFFMVVRKK